MPLSPPSGAPSASAARAVIALHAYGSRSAEQRVSRTAGKLDAALSDLARHVGLAGREHPLADLHTLSPAARFRQPASGATPQVLIDAVTRGDAKTLRDGLTALGLERASVYANDVGGWLPVTQIVAATAIPSLHSLRAAMPHTRTGAVTSQGDFAQRSDLIRMSYPTLTGSGITVGVLSDSFNCYAVYAQPNSGVPASGPQGYAPNGFTADAEQDVASGDLPANVDVLAEPYTESPSATGDCLNYGAPEQLPFTDEGRAMLQIVHDVAPGASLAFYTADDSEADFANGIGALAKAGATVEADDLGYFDEPFFQDGILAQAIDAVEAEGVAYFSAAGNDGSLSYENTTPSFATLSHTAPNSGEYLLNFDTSGATITTTLPVTVPSLYPGEFIAIVVEWDQPYVTGAPGSPGASSSIDLCITGSGSDEITDLDGNTVSCTGANATGVDPVQVLIIGNPANSRGDTATERLNLMVGLADGTPAPGRIKLVVEDDGAGSTIDAFATHSATVQGHPGAAGAAAVGAAFFALTPLCGTSPAQLESFSSAGGAPILFDTSGHRLATPVVRQKPNFVAPDGVNDTFLGFTLASTGITDDSSVSQCENDTAFPNFFGTSAATPHAASIAALMQQANSAVTPAQIYQALASTALAMGASTPNFDSGYGFVQADMALAQLPPAAPMLSASAASVAAGQSITLTWSSINTTGCTASGNWSGTLGASGSEAVTPTAQGTATYTLSCANAVASASKAVEVTVTAPVATGGGGGGGGTDGLTLLMLAAVAGVRAGRRLLIQNFSLHGRRSSSWVQALRGCACR
jgi:hypothetical protein